MLSSILLVGLLPCSLFPSGFPTKILYAFDTPMRATYPAHLSFNLFPKIIFGEAYKF